MDKTKIASPSRNADRSCHLRSPDRLPAPLASPLWWYARTPFIKIKFVQWNLDKNEAVNNLNTFIQSAAWASSKPRETNNPYSNFHLISDQICSLIVEKRRARTRYQSSRLLPHKSAYNKFVNSLKKFLKKRKTNACEQNLHALSIADGVVYG